MPFRSTTAFQNKPHALKYATFSMLGESRQKYYRSTCFDRFAEGPTRLGRLSLITELYVLRPIQPSIMVRKSGGHGRGYRGISKPRSSYLSGNATHTLTYQTIGK